jgi:hypothetical protein
VAALRSTTSEPDFLQKPQVVGGVTIGETSNSSIGHPVPLPRPGHGGEVAPVEFP